MKKFLASLLLLGSFPSFAFAENAFDQFMGTYEVTEEKCSDINPILDRLERIEIKKGFFDVKNFDDTFIYFYREGIATSVTNLSAYDHVIAYTESGGAVYSVSDSSVFSMEELGSSKFSFHFFTEWSASSKDECSYVLELR